jgi:integrase
MTAPRPPAPFPGVSSFIDPWGNERWRYRRAGVTISFKSEPTDAEYVAAVAAVAARQAAPRAELEPVRAPPPPPPAPTVPLLSTVKPGTLGDAWRLYRKDRAYKKLAASTRYQTDNVAAQFLLSQMLDDDDQPTGVLWRDIVIADLRRRHVLALLNERDETPHQASRILKFLRQLVLVAFNQEWIEVDPTAKIPVTRECRGHRKWSADECAAFEARHATGTTPRLVYALARYSGNRCGDLADLQWSHIVDGRLVVTAAEKTGVTVETMIGHELQLELDATARRGPFIVTTAYGEPFSKKSLGQRFLDWTRQAGIRAQLGEAGADEHAPTLHGLRTTFATMLADADATTKQLQAALGHTTLQQAERYTRDADRRRATDAAMALVARSRLRVVPGGKAGA